jgi:hypothetical protein
MITKRFYILHAVDYEVMTSVSVPRITLFEAYGAMISRLG